MPWHEKPNASKSYPVNITRPRLPSRPLTIIRPPFLVLQGRSLCTPMPHRSRRSLDRSRHTIRVLWPLTLYLTSLDTGRCLLWWSSLLSIHINTACDAFLLKDNVCSQLGEWFCGFLWKMGRNRPFSHHFGTLHYYSSHRWTTTLLHTDLIDTIRQDVLRVLVWLNWVTQLW